MFQLKGLSFLLKSLLKVPKSSSKSHVFGTPCYPSNLYYILYNISPGSLSNELLIWNTLTKFVLYLRFKRILSHSVFYSAQIFAYFQIYKHFVFLFINSWDMHSFIQFLFMFLLLTHCPIAFRLFSVSFISVLSIFCFFYFCFELLAVCVHEVWIHSVLFTGNLPTFLIFRNYKR